MAGVSAGEMTLGKAVVATDVVVDEAPTAEAVTITSGSQPEVVEGEYFEDDDDAAVMVD